VTCKDSKIKLDKKQKLKKNDKEIYICKKSKSKYVKGRKNILFLFSEFSQKKGFF